MAAISSSNPNKQHALRKRTSSSRCLSAPRDMRTTVRTLVTAVLIVLVSVASILPYFLASQQTNGKAEVAIMQLRALREKEQTLRLMKTRLDESERKIEELTHDMEEAVASRDASNQKASEAQAALDIANEEVKSLRHKMETTLSEQLETLTTTNSKLTQDMPEDIASQDALDQKSSEVKADVAEDNEPKVEASNEKDSEVKADVAEDNEPKVEASNEKDSEAQADVAEDNEPKVEASNEKDSEAQADVAEDNEPKVEASNEKDSEAQAALDAVNEQKMETAVAEERQTLTIPNSTSTTPSKNLPKVLQRAAHVLKNTTFGNSTHDIKKRTLEWNWFNYSDTHPQNTAGSRRVLLVQTVAWENYYFQMADASGRANKAFARRHGYDYLRVNGIFNKKTANGQYSTNAAYNKLNLLMNFTHHPKYDVMFLVDVDAVVVDFDYDVLSLIPEKVVFTASSVYAYANNSWDINNGVTLWNLHHPKYDQVVNLWWKRCEYKIHRRLGVSDQGPLHQVLRAHFTEEELQKDIIHVLHTNEFRYDQGTVVRHFVRHLEGQGMNETSTKGAWNLANGTYYNANPIRIKQIKTAAEEVCASDKWPGACEEDAPAEVS